jgi:hypothetical protein
VRRDQFCEALEKRREEIPRRLVHETTVGEIFPKRNRVDHQKVSFYNRLGITLVADLYVPKNLDRSIVIAMGALSPCAWSAVKISMGGWSPKAGRLRTATIHTTTSRKNNAHKAQESACGRASFNRRGSGVVGHDSPRLL